MRNYHITHILTSLFCLIIISTDFCNSTPLLSTFLDSDNTGSDIELNKILSGKFQWRPCMILSLIFGSSDNSTTITAKLEKTEETGHLDIITTDPPNLQNKEKLSSFINDTYKDNPDIEDSFFSGYTNISKKGDNWIQTGVSYRFKDKYPNDEVPVNLRHYVD